MVILFLDLEARFARHSAAPHRSEVLKWRNLSVKLKTLKSLE